MSDEKAEMASFRHLSVEICPFKWGEIVAYDA
jgi:hypothetical protein